MVDDLDLTELLRDVARQDFQQRYPDVVVDRVRRGLAPWGLESVPCFASTLRSESWQRQADQFTMRAPASFPSGRAGILVCYWDAAPDCGAVGPIVDSHDGLVIWRDFGRDTYFGRPQRAPRNAIEREQRHQVEQLEAESLNLSIFRKVGPFVFARKQYEEAFRQALAHPLRAKT